MVLTLESILKNPQIVGAVIDRTRARLDDPIQWERYLDFQNTTSRVFKSIQGNSSAVRMGSIIDKHSGKPIRGRKGLREGILEVADLGDKMQMDRARLDSLAAMLASGIQDANEIADFLVEDFREMVLAPHKRMDKVVGDLVSTGHAQVKEADNSKGVKVLDLSINMATAKTTSENKGKLMPFLQKLASEYSHLGFGVIEMSQETFFNRFATSKEFSATFKQKLGDSEVVASGILSEEAVSALFRTMGLPPVRVVNAKVEDINGAKYDVFTKDRLTFMPNGKIGKMRWHLPYEATDPVPNKAYSQQAGGHLISSWRTDEGRFIEYSAEWVPEINASRMLNVELAGLD